MLHRRFVAVCEDEAELIRVAATVDGTPREQRAARRVVAKWRRTAQKLVQDLEARGWAPYGGMVEHLERVLRLSA